MGSTERRVPNRSVARSRMAVFGWRTGTRNISRNCPGSACRSMWSLELKGTGIIDIDDEASSCQPLRGYIRAIETGVGNQNGRRQSKDFWKLPRRTRDFNL